MNGEGNLLVHLDQEDARAIQWPSVLAVARSTLSSSGYRRGKLSLGNARCSPLSSLFLTASENVLKLPVDS